jgi:5-methyltetrahydrofolate--homocysteine methyltransferase
MKRDLRERLDAGDIFVADGATGTMLMAAGLTPAEAPELWNLERPEVIINLHRAYLAAGSQIILTNTFGGNRIKLERAGRGGRVIAVNRAGARLARQAAGQHAYVAGDIGPTGDLMAPLGKLAFEHAVEVFAEQAEALATEEIDAIWIETMTDLQEARAAVSAALEATNLPIICSLSFGPGGRTMMGVGAGQAAQQLWPMGLSAMGANCGEGLGPVGQALREMREVLPRAPLVAKPNAGLPKLVEGETVYDVAPSDFAQHISGFVALGARIVGSCCGSSPAYIAAIAKALNGAR